MLIKLNIIIIIIIYGKGTRIEGWIESVETDFIKYDYIIYFIFIKSPIIKNLLYESWSALNGSWCVTLKDSKWEIGNSKGAKRCEESGIEYGNGCSSGQEEQMKMISFWYYSWFVSLFLK